MTIDRHLQVGIATADVTPPVGIAHGGWGAQDHERAAGIDMPMRVTVLALRSASTSVLVVDLDASVVSVEDADGIRAAIEESVDVPAANVRVSYSHTHSSPVMAAHGAFITAGRELVEPYRESMQMQAVGAAHAALGRLQPCRVAAGAGTSDVAVNRRLQLDDGRVVVAQNPSGVVDRRVFVTRFDDLEGRPVAGIVGYACHPITLAFQNDLLSPDYPGVVREVVEDLTGAPCLFLQGCAGDTMPVEAITGDTSVHRRLGTRLGAEAARVFLGIECQPTQRVFDRVVESGAPLGLWRREPGEPAQQGLTVASRTVRMPVRATAAPSRARREADQAIDRVTRLRADGAPAEQIRDATFRAKRSGMLARWAEWVDGGDAVDVTVQALGFGDVALVGFPGEPFAAIGMAVREASPFEHTHMAGYSNGWLGYVPTPDAFPLGGYEVETGSVYAREAADVLEREAVALLHDLFARLHGHDEGG